MVHSSIVIIDAWAISSPTALPLAMLQVDEDVINSGILKVLCAVRPFLSSRDDVPEDAVAIAIWPWDRTCASMVFNRKLFPVPRN